MPTYHEGGYGEVVDDFCWTVHKILNETNECEELNKKRGVWVPEYSSFVGELLHYWGIQS